MASKSYKPVIDQSLCKDCALCFSFCPKNIFIQDEEEASISVGPSDECIGCKVCEKMCPELAIQVKEHTKQPE